MIRFWYYAQVGIYVALAGLVLGRMLTNGVWMIELDALIEITNREYYLLLGFATVGVTAVIVDVIKVFINVFNKYIWIKD